MPGPVASTRIVTALLSFAEICSRNKRYILVTNEYTKLNFVIFLRSATCSLTNKLGSYFFKGRGEVATFRWSQYSEGSLLLRINRRLAELLLLSGGHYLRNYTVFIEIMTTFLSGKTNCWRQQHGEGKELTLYLLYLIYLLYLAFN